MINGAPLWGAVQKNAGGGLAEGDKPMISWSTARLAGIEFGDGVMTVAQIRRKQGGRLVLTHAGWAECDPSSPPRAIAANVRDLWKRAGITTRTVCASLRSASAVVRYFSVPSMTDAELAKTLRLQAEESLQMPATKLVVEWQVHPRSETLPGGIVPAITGILVAAPRQDVERQLEILDMAGLDPVIFDMRGLAVSNLVAALQPDWEGDSLCLMNLATHSADIMVRQHSNRFYPHTVYCRSSVCKESPGFLVENIRDVARYCEYKLGWDPISKLVMVGGSSPGDVLATTLRQELKVTVDCWNPLDVIRISGRKLEAILASSEAHKEMLAPVLGLAIRRM